MSRSARVALAVTFALAAVAVRGDDWDEGHRDGYDVSVDLNVQGGGVGFETFQEPLQPYGDWVVVGNYGRVWRPRVDAGWRPYYYGRWEWTNEGWFWASDEPWGWAAYHYGRWAYDPYYGWVWLPGNEWAPAWVSWRVSGDVVGWAPLAPGFSAYVTAYPFVDFWWTFVPSGRFCSMPVHSVAYAPGYARRWYAATAPAPAYVPRPGLGRGGGATPAWGGPAPRVIEQHLGRPLAPVRIVGSPSPGGRARPGEIAVYRPDRGFGARPVPQGTPAPGFAGRGGEHGVPAPGFAGRGGDRGVPAPGFAGRGGDRGVPAPGFAGRGGDHGGPAPGFDGRGGDRAAPAPGFVGRGGDHGSFPPGARPPEFRGSTAERAPEYRGPPPTGRAPEHRAPEAPQAAPPGRGGFAGGQGGGHGWAPPAGGDHAGGRGGWAPPGGGGGGGSAPQHGGGQRGGPGPGGHGRGERH
jgi:hypothetical protein